jgi:hypothetical protein
MKAYVYGTKRELPEGFGEFADATHTAIVAGFIGEILRNRTYHGHAVAVDLIACNAYVAVVLVTVAVFVWRHGIN